MTLNYDVIVVGSYSVDLIFTGMTDFPQPGIDVVGTDFKMTPGEAFISAVSMHRLGLKIGWAADFGNDDFSQFALQHVREENLDESLFVMHDRPYRRISVAASYPDERGFITYYDPEPTVPAAIPALAKATAKILFIPALYYGEFLTMGLKLVQAKKMLLFMDGNSSNGDMLGNSRQAKSIRKAIKNTDVILPNAREARRITGEENLEMAMRKLGNLGPLVVVKDGANGSYGLENDNLLHVPAILVDAKDTTGAGDNFNAGFICAWLDGQSLEICLKWGNIVGGLSTMELGGTTRRITRNEVEKYL